MIEQSRLRLPRSLVFTADHIPIGISYYVVDGTYAAHSHDFMEVAVIVGGTGMHRTIHGDQPVGSGDAFVLRPGSWHAYRNCQRLEHYNCCFGTELLRRELAWVLEDPLVGALFGTSPFSVDRRGVVHLCLSPDDLGACRQYLEALNRLESNAGDGGSQVTPLAGAQPPRLHQPKPGAVNSRSLQIGYLLLLLGTLAHSIDLEQRTMDSLHTHPAVLRAARLLEGNPKHTWTLQELADVLSMDPSYLVRLFKAGTGLPPMAYLTRYRAERAAHLLLRTDKSVTEVGAEVGWLDPSYFARRFKTCFGMSPSAYRRSFLTGDNVDHVARMATSGQRHRSR